MKRYIALLIALMLMFSMTACGGQQAEPAPAPATPAPTAAPTPAPTPAPTEEPAPVEPAWEPGVARARFGEALHAIVELGTEVEVKGKLDAYYVVSVPGFDVDLLVDEFVVRLQDEEPFEAWEKVGYTQSGTKVYTDAYMDGEVIAELSMNTNVNVVEGKGDWLRIEWEDQYGYVRAKDVSENVIVYYYGGGGGGGGGGPMDGTDVSLGGLASYIDSKPTVSLLSAYCGPEYEKLESKAAVISHDTRLYLHLTDRGEELKVTKVGEEECEIYIDGYTATVPRWLVRMAGDAEYEVWEGYAQTNARAYAEYQMRNELAKYGMNDRLTVVDELPDCYVIEYEGGFAYVELGDISETALVYYAGGGGGGGGGAEWTPPAL